MVYLISLNIFWYIGIFAIFISYGNFVSLVFWYIIFLELTYFLVLYLLVFIWHSFPIFFIFLYSYGIKSYIYWYIFISFVMLWYLYDIIFYIFWYSCIFRYIISFVFLFYILWYFYIFRYFIFCGTFISFGISYLLVI